MTKTLSVSAIQNGTVIDHIPRGQAFRILQLLKLLNQNYKMTVGLNLPSQQMQFKDLIKIENHQLKNDEANEITIFAPMATINIIENFEVIQKIITKLPEKITNVFVCPNHHCITLHEKVASVFFIKEHNKEVHITCQYCEKTFNRNEVSVKI